MQRARRFASFAVMALIGVFALSGCQNTASDVAVQIGDMRFTNSQVDDIVDQVDTDRLEAAKAEATPAATPEGLPSSQFGGIRQQVVGFVVFNELARRYAAEKGLAETTPPDYAGIAPQLGLAADNPYVKLAADSDAYRTLLMSKIAPVQPTEADLVEAYDRIKKASPDVPSYEEIKPQLVALPDLADGLALRAELNKALGQYSVTVNPRYEPLEIPLVVVTAGSTQITLVTLPIYGSPASPAVRDLS